jgi:hypothetical protein
VGNTCCTCAHFLSNLKNAICSDIKLHFRAFYSTVSHSFLGIYPKWLDAVMNFSILPSFLKFLQFLYLALLTGQCQGKSMSNNSFGGMACALNMFSLVLNNLFRKFTACRDHIAKKFTNPVTRFTKYESLACLKIFV